MGKLRSQMNSSLAAKSSGTTRTKTSVRTQTARPSAPAAAAAEPSRKDSATGTGIMHGLNKLLGYSAWACLIGAAVVAVSADGLGYCGFHTLPAGWGDSLHAIVQ